MCASWAFTVRRWDYKNLSWVWGTDWNFGRGSLFGIMRLRRVRPNSDPEGRMFLSAPNNHDGFFLLHTFWPPAFDLNVGVPINESCSFTLMSAILKFDVVCSCNRHHDTWFSQNSRHAAHYQYMGSGRNAGGVFRRFLENHRVKCHADNTFRRFRKITGWSLYLSYLNFCACSFMQMNHFHDILTNYILMFLKIIFILCLCLERL